ncbi:unnamed protein product [Linum tenue]|uniref:Secreted protein n=1 Tax=Linum tenue TaxID=586396 RepID=A0AAV0R4Q8_9ROSI|nr:unnamed protein product [Linum tenue]
MRSISLAIDILNCWISPSSLVEVTTSAVVSATVAAGAAWLGTSESCSSVRGSCGLGGGRTTAGVSTEGRGPAVAGSFGPDVVTSRGAGGELFGGCGTEVSATSGIDELTTAGAGGESHTIVSSSTAVVLALESLLTSWEQRHRRQKPPRKTRFSLLPFTVPRMLLGK